MAQKKDVIKSISPREHVRLRPGMYISSVDNPNHLMIEVFANALDMHNAGFGDIIKVDINDNNVCRCEDCGTGFPINKKRKDGKTVLQASFDQMNTSGKYDSDGFYNGTSLGLNGAGGKAVNFLSEWFEVMSWQKGKYEKIRFEKGIMVSQETGDYKDNTSGTIVEYYPDKEIFDTVVTDRNYFNKFFDEICFLCNNLTIKYNGKQYRHDTIERAIDTKMPSNAIELCSNRLILENDKINLVLTYTTSSSSSFTSYVNYGYTEGGPHITALKSTITRTFNKWAKENNILKEKDKNLDGTSLQEGCIVLFNIMGKNIVYDSQSKHRVTKIDTSCISSDFGAALEMWLDNNPTDAANIIDKALTARKAAEAAKKARARVKAAANEKKDKVFKLPTKLTDCYSKDRSKCELVICEGKSAASGLVAARDSEFQAVYGVRGKMLSVLKSTPEKILANQEINNIIQALGLDYNLKTAKMVYDKDKLRYHKIIAACDADPDGNAIENLLFNILWYLCPELIIEGHVYSAVPPLFRVTTKKNEYVYLKDADALKEYQTSHSSSIKSIGRNKGLGEQDSDELSETLLDPNTRHIVKLTVSDIGATDDLFNDLYGKKVEPRVKFLLEHSEEGEYDYS